MLEKVIEKKVCEYAEKQGFLCFKFISSQTGVPDRILISKEGDVFFIEFKQATGRLFKKQKHIKEKLEAHNAKVYIVRTVEEGIQILNSYLKK